MQIISLIDHWRAMISDNIDIDVDDLDAFNWETTSLPLNTTLLEKLTIPNRIWLQREFMMPINEECSTWWLESNLALVGRVWLNGKLVYGVDDGDIYQIEVTNYTALDQNILVLCLEPTHDLKHWRELKCVPYPCHD